MASRRLHARHPLLIGGVALGVYALDQLSKSWAVDHLANGRTVELIGSLRLNLAFNSGAAFSQGTGIGPFIALLAIVVVVALLWTGRSATSRVSAVAVGMVVGGALGNLSDRLLREGPGGFFGGSVVDFIDLQWWPIFNVADSAVVVGGLLLVVSAGFGGHEGDGDHGDQQDDRQNDQQDGHQDDRHNDQQDGHQDDRQDGHGEARDEDRGGEQGDGRAPDGARGGAERHR